MSARYPRPNSAVEKFNFQTVLKSGPGFQTLKGTTPAAAGALPQVSSTVQEFTPVQFDDSAASTVVCSGTWLKIGDTWGCLTSDTPVATASTAYAYTGEFLMLLDAAATAAVGADAYMIIADAEVTETAGTNDYLGKFTSGNLVNPTGMPAGTYATVKLMQSEL